MPSLHKWYFLVYRAYSRFYITCMSYTPSTAIKTQPSTNFKLNQAFFFLNVVFSSAGAISTLSWSPKGSRFACCSSTGTIQVYSGSNREYVPSIRIRELQATALSWSPDERLLTTLEPEGAVKVREKECLC